VPAFNAQTRNVIWWTAVGGENIKYDMVRGDLAALRSSGGNFNTAECFVNDYGATSVDVSGTPPAGGWWFLVRPTDVCGGGTYNTTSPRQVQSRDAEIAASPNACP
jgi:hypothetical protein